MNSSAKTLAERTMTCLLSLILFLGGCYAVKPSDIPGRYVAKADWGEVVLELRRDGTFVEAATLTDGSNRRIEGKWKFTDHRISRSPECLGINHSGISKQNWSGCTSSVSGHAALHLEISIDPDFGLAYRK